MSWAVAHHYALPWKTRDAQHAGVSQQMYLPMLWTGAGESLAMHFKQQQWQKRLRGITLAVAVAYYSVANSGPASMTSSSLAFLNFFSMGGGILATEGLMSAQILAPLDSSVSLVPHVIYNLSQPTGCVIPRNGVQTTSYPPGCAHKQNSDEPSGTFLPFLFLHLQ